jgi:hypothetical protein
MSTPFTTLSVTDLNAKTKTICNELGLGMYERLALVDRAPTQLEIVTGDTWQNDYTDFVIPLKAQIASAINTAEPKRFVTSAGVDYTISSLLIEAGYGDGQWLPVLADHHGVVSLSRTAWTQLQEVVACLRYHRLNAGWCTHLISPPLEDDYYVLEPMRQHYYNASPYASSEEGAWASLMDYGYHSADQIFWDEYCTWTGDPELTPPYYYTSLTQARYPTCSGQTTLFAGKGGVLFVVFEVNPSRHAHHFHPTDDTMTVSTNYDATAVTGKTWTCTPSSVDSTDVPPTVHAVADSAFTPEADTNVEIILSLTAPPTYSYPANLPFQAASHDTPPEGFVAHCWINIDLHQTVNPFAIYDADALFTNG